MNWEYSISRYDPCAKYATERTASTLRTIHTPGKNGPAFFGGGCWPWGGCCWGGWGGPLPFCCVMPVPYEISTRTQSPRGPPDPPGWVVYCTPSNCPIG